MGRISRFVQPEVVRLDISGGDWIEIKKQLTVKETRKMQLGSAKMVGAPGKDTMEISVDLETFGLEKIKTYLVNWSFHDHEDRPVALTSEAIDSLDEPTYLEIEKAIDAHTESLSVEKKPKATGGRRRSKAISP